ncbi:hypothetical protein GGTG_02715 [Gaeumannomyces tritici R3-111a-1]|uniref:MSP domain-containing protein n=1 Tax=Gaeumannomyces tritici (strain R3-111a-1) TaxID=644352 RepID=J3NN57_GAET3|nr:hypothetical protein GGTG_02715 [Gaeumannomyces tritici R3-111a-1]EJT77609.1 hypothetical protein GGTG_02715 [Gaeumannomyces tritici R3-111a-1]
MSVELDPSELGFQRPFTSEVAQVLRIRNPNSLPVAFKVKTTAPKQYCVRPNSGRIEPDQEVQVQVLLQAMKVDPPADAKCRDKFLVQAVQISPDKAFTSVSEIWDAAPKSSIQERKIRVSFLPADNGSGAVATTPARSKSPGSGGDATPDVAPPSYSSPAAHPPASRQSLQPEPSPSADKRKTLYHESPLSTAVTDATSALSAATAQVSNSKPVEQVKEKVAEAKSAVAAKVEDSGLKQRKLPSAVKSAPSAPAPVTQVHPAARQETIQGVPVHVVAALCLLSFLLAYFFF